ncbi:choice-of-anchor R domain-containing protein [Aquisphaera insulae]|uniref:choice-of-anchor R domain-containing protein n=1 Tax=Aquisphaera insulae TaxID=2712864 RepID=UPI0013EDA901|nr:choice-of-anchor R domain-containing protein [Aquisphaera insulae]
MPATSRRHWHACRLAALAALLFAPALARADTILSDNLSNASAGTESITGDTWLAASFGTDSSAYSLASVTLRLERTSIKGSVEVQVFDDGGLQPGNLVGTLTGPADVPSSPSDVTFSASGITLSASSTYWIVVVATTGSFEWSWSGTDSGSGVGYQGLWGSTDDAGLTWFPYTSYPLQMSVAATAIPEPGSIVPFACGVAVTGAVAAARKRRSAALHD